MRNLNKFYVYIISNPSSKVPFYVGKGCGKRIYKHFKLAFSKPTSRLHRKILKITKDFSLPSVEIYWCENEYEAFIREIFAINVIGRKDLRRGPLINMTDGGEGNSGFIVSEKTKEKISKKLKGKPLTDETKRKMSIAGKGKILSEESKRKLSISRKGIKFSEETKKKISNALKNRKPISEITRKKLSLAALGKPKSEETKLKMKIARNNRNG